MCERRLKKAVFDKEGHLRLGYWSGNESVKGTYVAVDLGPRGASGNLTVEGHGEMTAVPFDNVFGVLPGIVLEGTLTFRPAEHAGGRCGIFVEETGETATAILLGSGGQTQLGTLKLTGAATFEPDHDVQAGITPGVDHRFRLLIREYMMEFYLDDMLVQCYSLPPRATGRIGIVVQGGDAVVRDLKAWNMTFADANHKILPSASPPPSSP